MEEACKSPKTPARRKQMRSCDDCYRRKVRCDSINQEPCRACRRSHIECRFTRQWKKPMRTRNRKAHRERHEHLSRSEPGLSGASSPSKSLPTAPSDSSMIGHSHPDVVGSEIIISQDLVRSGLSQFISISIGVSSSSWDVFDQLERVRIAYIGTEVTNLTHLIELEHSEAATVLHHPYPHIKPPLAWRPDVDASDNLRSPNLLQDLCSFPAKDVRDDLVDSFFAHIHPYLPIIDEFEFRNRYGDPQNPPPLLLLQSVLLAGAHASHHPRVAQARSTVMAVLFRRAKTLFDMRHENDRMNLVQAAILFTWHIENADSVSSNSWYWSGVACRIAFGIGMHRDLSRNSGGRFPKTDRRLYRRIWWTLFQIEITSALEHGRPSMIRLEDFDQPPLEMDDLRDSNEVTNSNIRFEYCCRKTELCFIALEVSRLSSPGVIAHAHANSAAIQSVNTRLLAWARSAISCNDYEGLVLHIFYQTVVIHWHRASVNKTLIGKGQASDICKGASKSILVNFESLVAQDLLFKCHFFKVASLTAAAIQTHQEIQSAFEQGQALQAINALNDLDRVLRIAKGLAEYWPNAEAVYKLFKGLFDKLKASAIDEDGMSDMNQPFGNHENGLGDINWHEILAYQPLEEPVNEGWLNDLPEIVGES